MTKPKVVRNVYCTDPEDRVIEWSCPRCVKCWKFISGKRSGTCPFGGPFNGYVDVSK